MSKESLFNHIRQENTVLWIGAGMSIKSGYPSGEKLTSSIYKSLTKSEQQQVDPNQPLMEIAEQFVRIKGGSKNHLIRILKDIFENEIRDSEPHHKLASIPHIKTIITTNFDKLIEQALGNKCQVLTSSKQVPYIDKNQSQVFKVHGDLTDPDSIILTKSDYTNFFRFDSENEPYWNVIKERISTNNILFLGYNLEDPNTSVVFDKIAEVLGNHQKEKFVVAPNLPEHKKNDLIRKGIHYIDDFGENLIDKLIKDIRTFIVRDFENGSVSPSTFQSFLSLHGIQPEIKGNDEGFSLSRLHPTNDSTEGLINFTIKKGEIDEQLADFLEGRYFGELEITEEKLEQFDFKIGQIKISDGEDIGKLKIQSTPKVVTKIDILLASGHEFMGIPLKIYGSKSRIEFQGRINNSTFTAFFDPNNLPEMNVTFSHEHDEKCGKVSEEIQLFEFMKEAALGQEFTAFTGSGKSVTNIFPSMPQMVKDCEYYLQYFYNLRTIERQYNLRFTEISINSIDIKAFRLAQVVVAAINNEELIYDWHDQLQAVLTDTTTETLSQFETLDGDEKCAPVEVIHKTEEFVEIHGQKISLGYKKVLFPQPYVTNLDQLKLNKESTAIIKSKSNKIIVHYLKEIPST